MNPALEWLAARTGGERALLVLSLISGALLFLTVALVIVAFVTRWRNTRIAREWARVESAWEDQVIEVLEGLREPDAVARAIAPADTWRFVEYLSRYARRLRGAEQRRVRQLAGPFLPAVAVGLAHRDPGFRARAIQILSLLGLPEYGPNLIRALDDPEAVVAMVAARSLARRDHPAFAPAILSRLARFTHWDPRFLAAMLASMGPEAARALLDVLRDPAQPGLVRTVAADALAMLSHLPAADAAVAALEDGDRELSAAALRLLRQVGRPEHLPAIRRRLDSDDFVIREHAVAAFGVLAAPAELPLLVPGLEDASPWVRFAAARALRAYAGGQLLRDVAKSGGSTGLVAQTALEETAA